MSKLSFSIKPRNRFASFTWNAITASLLFAIIFTVNGCKRSQETSTPAPPGSSSPPGTFSITLVFPGLGSTQAVITWETASGASSYTIKRGTTSGTYPTTLSTTATSPYTDTGLSVGATYYYMVTAVNGKGNTDASAEGTVTFPSGTFSISSASPGKAKATLTWGDSVGAASYTIKRGTSSGSYPTTVSTSATSPYVDTGANGGATYYYMITAVNAGGSTDADAEVSATPMPGAFSISSASPGTAQVTLTWGDSAGAATYTIKRGTSSGSYPTTVSTSATSPYVDTGANGGATYYYMITAINAGGSTDASTEAFAAPTPGSFNSSASPGNTQVTISWGASAGAASYTIKRGTTSGSYPTTLSTSATSPYTNTGLTNGTTYYYMVTAVSAGGSRNANAEASATPIDPPGAFAISSAVAGNAQVTLTWGASAGAASYTIKRGTSTGSYPTTVTTSATSPYVDTGANGGATYYYMISAVNAGGSTNANAEASATPTPGTFSFTSAVKGYTKATLNWGNSAGAASYTLKRGTASGVYPVTLSSSATRPYVDTGLTEGTTYYYQVVAVNSGGSTNVNAEAVVIPTWTQQFGASSRESYGRSIATDSSGYAYVAGETFGDLTGSDPSNASPDLFIAKYDGVTQRSWLKQDSMTFQQGNTYYVTNANYANGIVTDASANVYVAGRALAGCPGSSGCLFVAKYNSAGTKQWSTWLGSGYATGGFGIALDASGNIYVTGYKDLNANVGSHVLNDLVVAKFDTSGANLWVQQLGVASHKTYGRGVVVDSSGNVYVTGETITPDPNSGGYLAVGFVVAKYDTSGAWQWTNQIGTLYTYSNATGIARDSADNIYVTGYTQDPVDGSVVQTGSADLFLIKYNGAGSASWFQQYGVASGYSTAQGIAVDSSDEIYLAGSSTGDFDGITKVGQSDMLLVKVNTSGVKQWSRMLGAAASAITSATSVATDASGNAYVAGYTNTGLDGNTQTGLQDVFVTKYDSSGTKQ